ncbi:hypothetical protein [Arthrobacter sp. UYP6]|uniref:hypothetical protein n=1 Tax=Arthrobacter sp. UYP6 TaxID=1756378 RepID=UPI00339878AA
MDHAAEHEPGKPADCDDGATPLELSWFAPALLLVWLSMFAMVSASADGRVIGWVEPGAALIYAAAAALVGLAVFVPVRPSALMLRAGVYAFAVLLVTILLIFTEPGIYAGILTALLPAWALGTALYGVRGGLPKGVLHILLYAVAAPVAAGIGYVAALILFFLAFAGFPVQIFLGLPLLQLLLLLNTSYRRHRTRTLVEIILSVLVCGSALFGLVGDGPGWSPDLGAAAALLVYIVAAVPTAVLLGLGYLSRFDTAEYLTRAQRRTSAWRARP